MSTLMQTVVRRLGLPLGFRLARLYPPFLGAGVRVTEVAADGSRVVVELPLTIFNRNFVGAHFGGAIFTMCDPFFMIMLMVRLGPEYVVWDRAAAIEFLKPGRGTLRATFELPDAEVEAVRRRADAGEKVHPEFEVTARAEDGTAVARVRKTLYVRRKDFLPGNGASRGGRAPRRTAPATGS